jgi:4-diphosphocytidyl-2-C-methyl-D-erythritol kinase
MPRAFAKINIGLLVLPKRADGYHDLLTVFHRVNVFDEILFEPDSDIEVVSSSPEAPDGEQNICHRAAHLLREHLTVSDGVRIIVKKGIPAGAGLGGGSADAGCVLRELPRYWNKEVPKADLAAIALRLGSDVPYFLTPGTALGQGRGEILSYFSLRLPYTVLLCNPNIHVATGWAYQQVTPRSGHVDIDLRDYVIRGCTDPRVLREHVVNDFERAVFASHPDIEKLKADMLNTGAAFSLMSGSGSTVYGFYQQRADANHAADQFAACGYRVFITPPDFSPE